ncbi:MAG: sugar ABC transporter permease [Caldilineaceae bacterium]|nr:sugar ABC transporter permease [Caldilineaceae bacterium]
MSRTLSARMETTAPPQRIPLEKRLGLPRDALLGYAMLVPGLALILILVGYPFTNSIWLSFHRKLIGVPDASFIGLQNYLDLFTDEAYWTAVRNVFVFTGVSVAIKLVLGTLVSVILNERLPMRGLLRSFVLLPWAMPTLVTVLTWRWMYNDLFGVFNYLMLQAGLINTPLAWLGTRDLAMPAVIIVNIWRGFPFFAISLLAGLQSVPSELYDAGKVDGAGVLNRFRHITLPNILPVMAVVTLLSTIWTFNDFAIIWLLTQGGPSGATEVLSTLTYRIAIGGTELGKGVAVSVTLMPLLLLLIILLTRMTTAREERL